MTLAAGGNAFTWVGSVGAALAFIAGFAAKWIAEIIQHKHVTEREREARRELRRDLLLQRRDDFQRQNLLDLQEACMQLIRAAGRTSYHDTMTFRQTGKWHGTPVPDETDNEFLLGQARTAVLMVRIRDEEVRKLADAMKSRAAALSTAPNQIDSDAALFEAWRSHDQLNQRIGETLREMEDGEIYSTEPLTRQITVSIGQGRGMNLTGLAMELIGVVMLFRFGMPFRVQTGGHSFITVDQVNPSDIATEHTYAVLGYAGLALLLVGTSFQIAAVLLPRNRA